MPIKYLSYTEGGHEPYGAYETMAEACKHAKDGNLEANVTIRVFKLVEIAIYPKKR